MKGILDIAGIGIGPFNLSLAALMAPLPEVSARFYERRPSFDWHPGMMLPGTQMQTSFLKDLVTPVDPTSPYGFLAYLVRKGRFYRFVNADFPRAKRAEFADYLRWVSEQVPNLVFRKSVEEVSFDDQGFLLSFGEGAPQRSRHLAVAIGHRPHVPDWARSHLGRHCLHSHSYMTAPLSVENRRVTIVGGGQSGAEIFLDLMGGARGRPVDVVWVTRRPGLDPLDETAFTNEYFTPDYVRHFHRLPELHRHNLATAQKLTGDGVSPATLQALSQYLYERDFLDVDGAGVPYRIMTHREVRGMARERTGFRLDMANVFDESPEHIGADIVILATGYRYAWPECLAPLDAHIERDGQGFPILSEDYVARWDGPAAHRIYMLNAGRNSHGVADAQLSLTAWRSAVIINSLVGRAVYAVDPQPSPVHWSGGRPDSQAGGLEPRLQVWK
ncbi:lysine N(6)-hydroxylase/L-ornithine N(5)-oxygenase family protein [Methylolobus aquaticus]